MTALQILCQALLLILGLAAPAGGGGAVDATSTVREQAAPMLSGTDACPQAPGSECRISQAPLLLGGCDGATGIEDEERICALLAPAVGIALAIRAPLWIGVPAAVPVRSARPVTDGLSRGPPALG